ncbi:MAG: hypothetical protein EAX90_11430 [Candidatus Heimdallarchaeota archaeon]|nr:hypothetical protein [Candidatus Heimdallarchaeota archaeon]
MNNNLTGTDPLVIFRCRNKQCRQIFSPSIIMNDVIVQFVCPICGSRYEAQYINTGVHSDQQAIMLIETPRLVYLGTRIASS